MALPIPLELPPRDPREALYQRLQSAPLEHVEALLALYEVLQGLHDRGVLEVLRGALGSSDRMLQIVVDAVKTPEGIRAIRNLLILARITGQLEPELLEGVARAVSEGQAQTQAPLGLWQLAQKLNSQDSRRALTTLASVLESVGRSLDDRRR